MKFTILSIILIIGWSPWANAARPTTSTPVTSTQCIDGYKFAIIQTTTSLNSHQIRGVKDRPIMCGQKLQDFHDAVQSLHRARKELEKQIAIEAGKAKVKWCKENIEACRKEVEEQ